MSPAITISQEEITVWTRYIQEICGVSLNDTKGYLFETRLGPILAESGSASFSELYYKTKGDSSNRWRLKIIDAITTNETSFFRDTSTFELLRHKLLPEVIDRNSKAGGRAVPIRIWSAACSTGQEIYSIAMVIKELLGDLRGYDVRLMGTDISDRVIAQASHGYFSQLEVDRGLTPTLLNKYFTREGEKWKVRDELRSLATFRNMNLLTPYSFPSPFDIIFCRNVAIYFTEPDKIRLFRSLGKCLARGGALVIGSTESIAGLCPEFVPQRYLRAVYYSMK